MRYHLPWFVNRLSRSVRRLMQQQIGFEVTAEILQEQQSGIMR
jgi:hypothetical protein